MEESEYHKIEVHAEQFFQKLRRVVLGLAVLAATLVALGILFYVMGW